MQAKENSNDVSKLWGLGFDELNPPHYLLNANGDGLFTKTLFPRKWTGTTPAHQAKTRRTARRGPQAGNLGLTSGIPAGFGEVVALQYFQQTPSELMRASSDEEMMSVAVKLATYSAMQRTPPGRALPPGRAQSGISELVPRSSDPDSPQPGHSRQRSPGGQPMMSDSLDESQLSDALRGASASPTLFRPCFTLPLHPVSSEASLRGGLVGVGEPAVMQWDVPMRYNRAKLIKLTHPQGRLIIDVMLGTRCSLGLVSKEGSEVTICGSYTSSQPATLSLPVPLGRSEFIITHKGGSAISVVRFTVMNAKAAFDPPAPSLLICGDVEANPGPGPLTGSDTVLDLGSKLNACYVRDDDPPEVQEYFRRKEQERLARMHPTKPLTAKEALAQRVYEDANEIWHAAGQRSRYNEALKKMKAILAEDRHTFEITRKFFNDCGKPKTTQEICTMHGLWMDYPREFLETGLVPRRPVGVLPRTENYVPLNPKYKWEGTPPALAQLALERPDLLPHLVPPAPAPAPAPEPIPPPVQPPPPTPVAAPAPIDPPRLPTTPEPSPPLSQPPPALQPAPMDTSPPPRDSSPPCADPDNESSLPFGVQEDIRARATSDTPEADYYYVLCKYINIEVRNKFDLLCVPDASDPNCDGGLLADFPEAEDTDEQPPKRKQKLQPSATGSGPSSMREGTSPPRKVPRMEPEKTREMKAAQKRAVLRRIADKLRRDGAQMVDHWLSSHNPTRTFATLVAMEMLGADWQRTRKWTEVHILFDDYLNGLDNRGLYPFRMMVLHPYYRDLCATAPNALALLAESKLHNKRMHAYNGNTETKAPATSMVVVNDFQDIVTATVSSEVMFAKPWVGEHILHDSDFAPSHGELYAIKNPVEGRYDEADRLKFKAQLRTGVGQDVNSVVYYPSSPMLPRNFCHPVYDIDNWTPTPEEAAASATARARAEAHNKARVSVRQPEFKTLPALEQACVLSQIHPAHRNEPMPTPDLLSVDRTHNTIVGPSATTRLKFWEVESVPVPGHTLIPTDKSVNLSNLMANEVGNTVRFNSQTLQGFQTPDLLALSLQTPYLGLTSETMALKLLLLTQALVWKNRWECLPAMTRTVFDPYAKARREDLTIGINASPVFGENCGGTANPVFPMAGGSGTLRLHTSLNTVPHNARGSAIFIPNNMIDLQMDSGKALAIILMMFTDWPFCMIGYFGTVDHKNTPADHPVALHYRNYYVASPSLVHVAGSRHIDLILPATMVEERGPGARSALPRWQFSSGVQATNTLPPSTPLQYCRLGPNGVIDHYVRLTDYLVSWIASVTVDEINQVMVAVNNIFPFGTSVATMRDLAISLTYMYPKLILGLQGAYPVPPVVIDGGHFSSKVLMDYTSGSCMSPHQVTGDFPLTQTFSGDAIVKAFDPTAWNKVALGLSKIDEGMIKSLDKLNNEYVHKGVIMRDLARSLMFAATSQFVMAWQGASCKAWETMRSNFMSQWIMHVLPLMVGNPTQRPSLVLAPASFVFSNVMFSMMGRRTTTTVWRFEDGVERPVDLFGRLCYTGSFASVYTTGGNLMSGYCPVIIEDAWYQMLAKWLPMGWLPFAPPSSTLDNKVFTSAKIWPSNNSEVCEPFQMTIDGVHYRSAGRATDARETYNPLRIFRWQDEERWNVRLFATSAKVFRLVTVLGRPIDGVVQTGELPWGRRNYLHDGEQMPPEHLGQATMCLPNYDHESSKMFIVLPKDEALAITTTGTGNGFAPRARWIVPGSLLVSMLDIEGKFVDEWSDMINEAMAGFRIVESAKEAPVTDGVGPAPPVVEQTSSAASRTPSEPTAAPTS